MECITDWAKYQNPVNSAHLLAGCSDSTMPQPSRQMLPTVLRLHIWLLGWSAKVVEQMDMLVTAVNLKFSRDFKTSLENISQV